jgi:hypothetical protein
MATVKFAGSSICAWAPLIAALSGCGNADEDVGAQRAPLVAVCATSADSVPDDVWLCGEPRTVECDALPGTASPTSIYAVVPDGCDNRRLLVDEGPFAVGEHEIVVREQLDAAVPPSELCRSRLNVVDTTPPRAHPLHATLWPPNHQLHTFSARACAGVVDACDPDVVVRFTTASSDEPVDATGDGASEPDIVFNAADAVALRAERQGPEDGRVYTLGFLARDAAGNEVAGNCTLEVPHDQSGAPAVAGPVAYSLAAPTRP